MWFYNSLIYINYIVTNYSWIFFEILFLILWIIVIKKFLISSRISLLTGLFLLFLSMLFVVFGNDAIAGKFAEISFLFISTGYIQAFVLALRNHEK